MSSEPNRTPLGLRISAIAGLLFLHLPLALIVLYAFTTEEKSFQFPPPGYTTKWFAIAWSQRPDIWPPLYLSLEVAAIATCLALIFGTLAAAALSRAKFFGRETISLLLSCRSRFPASSPAYRCVRPSTSWVSLSRSGPSFSGTPHSASWWFTTTPSPAFGGSPVVSSRRPWISAPTALRPSVM